jgi:hypothetical protein
MNMDIYLAQARVRTKVVSARANAALARLGGETARHSRTDLTEGLSAEQIERDAKSIRNILHVWKVTGKGGPGSTIILPSGRQLKAPGSNGTRSQFEMAVIRPHKYKKGRR